MSKAFALAGGRVGYLAAAPELVDALRLVRLPYHLSTPTQAVARAALAHASTMLGHSRRDQGRAGPHRRRADHPGLPAGPERRQLRPVRWPRRRGRHLAALLEQGVLVRNVGIRHHLRVTAGTPPETTAFLDAMRALPATHRYGVADPDSVPEGARA